MKKIIPDILRRNCLMPVGICVLVFIVFFPTLNNELTNWDDSTHLADNFLITPLGIESVKKMFETTINKTYIPLTMLSFAAENHFFPQSIRARHGTNLVIHLLIILLVYAFSRMLGGNIKTASLAALIFGIHPLHVEPVAWVVARKDLLYTMFYLSALISYCHYVRSQKKWPFCLSIILGLLSMLSKPMAISLPVILCVCDGMMERKWSAKLIWEKIPYLIYTIPIAWMTYSLHARIPGKNISEAIVVWVWTTSFYIQKFIFPYELSPLYNAPKPVAITNNPYIVASLVLLLSVLLLIRFRSNKWFKFAFAYYFFSIFFLLRYDLKADLTIVADRFMYLPSLGFCIFLAFLYSRWWENVATKKFIYKIIGSMTMAIVFSGLMVKTYDQSQIWKDDLTMWTHVIEHIENSSIPYNNRGIAFKRRGRYKEAIADFNKAIEIDPHFAKAYNNRGSVHSIEHQFELALNDYSRVLIINPENAKGYNNRGVLYGVQGEFNLAVSDFNKALSIDPVYSAAFYNRSRALYGQKKYRLALNDITRAQLLGHPVDINYLNEVIKLTVPQE